jgi:hypothetical protein
MRPTALKLTAGILLTCGLSSLAQAQVDKINVVTTAVPFLRISPDARSGGMGDVGVATSPDASAGFWNIGKVAFNESKGGVVATYTPWLKDLVNDVYLATVGGYYKFQENQAVNISLRYFSLGNIQFTDGLGNDWGSAKPREFSVDLGYSRKLSNKVESRCYSSLYQFKPTGEVLPAGPPYKVGSTVPAISASSRQNLPGN